MKYLYFAYINAYICFSGMKIRFKIFFLNLNITLTFTHTYMFIISCNIYLLCIQQNCRITQRLCPSSSSRATITTTYMSVENFQYDLLFFIMIYLHFHRNIKLTIRKFILPQVCVCLCARSRCLSCTFIICYMFAHTIFFVF